MFEHFAAQSQVGYPILEGKPLCIGEDGLNCPMLSQLIDATRVKILQPKERDVDSDKVRLVVL